MKTFAEDDKIALVYKNTGGTTVKVESAALTLVDITNEGRNAKSTFEVTAPDKEQDVTYIYPAAGYREGSTVTLAGDYGYYWSSSLKETSPYLLLFAENTLNPASWNYRSQGLSVRLIGE